MNVRKGYKVVSVLDSGLGSVFGSAYLNPIFRGFTTYEQYVWTHRKEGCGPLGVFNSLEDAQEFICRNTVCLYAPVKIFKVDYVISRSHRMWYSRSAVRFGHFPPGTVFANSVKLLEEVSYEV